MSEILETHVRGVSAPGQQAKAVSLGVDANGVALWTWMAKDTTVVPGMTFRCENVSFGKLQESYTKDGVEVALKRPRRQVFCHAVATLGAPQTLEVVSEVQLTPEALAFAERALAKAEAEATDQDEGPF